MTFYAEPDISRSSLKQAALLPTLKRLWFEYQNDLKELGLRTRPLEDEMNLKHWRGVIPTRTEVRRISAFVAVNLDHQEEEPAHASELENLVPMIINQSFSALFGFPTDVSEEFPSLTREIMLLAGAARYNREIQHRTESVRADRLQKQAEQAALEETKQERLRIQTAQIKEFKRLRKRRMEQEKMRKARVRRFEEVAESADSEVPTKRQRTDDEIAAALVASRGDVAAAIKALSLM
jgi:hypothetical protein